MKPYCCLAVVGFNQGIIQPCGYTSGQCKLNTLLQTHSTEPSDLCSFCSTPHNNYLSVHKSVTCNHVQVPSVLDDPLGPFRMFQPVNPELSWPTDCQMIKLSLKWLLDKQNATQILKTRSYTFLMVYYYMLLYRFTTL